MTNFFKTFLVFFLTLPVFSQNTNISGVINTYHSVSSIQSNTISVASTSGMLTNDLMLIIQMQGANITESNTSSFGNISAYNSAGNYEYVRICQVLNATQIVTTQIQRTYNSAGKIQLITVPEYNDANVISTLTADPWDGQKGGVLVFECSGALTLNANIDLQGLGFRGGDVNTSSFNCSWLINNDDYFYDLSTGRGATKGEGIANYITGKTAGQGKQANGGGGGNDHNAGGGGGSNAGSAGNGGERIAINGFSCSGPNTGNGGAALPYTSNKVFLGGGGGAGHQNNIGSGASGMDGGGIVIIKANTIIGNSNTINVSGEAPLTNSEDGAGGGAGGGAILLDITTYSNTINLNANGSNGVSVSNVGSANCNGPGGGGSGGVFLYSNTVAPSNASAFVNGGSAGTTLASSQSSCSVGGTNNAQNGNNGLIIGGLNFFEPTSGVHIISDSLMICSTDSVFLENAWQNTPAVYYDSTIGNCSDTIIETTLTWHTEVVDTINTSICFGESLLINGTVYNTAITGAIEVFSGGTQNGCDSTLIVNIEVLPAVVGTDTQANCDSLFWIDGNVYNTSNNSASFVIQNGSSLGCDSTVFLNYTLITVDALLSQSGFILSANAAGAAYQWLDCSNGYLPIIGEVNQFFYPSQNGLYAVEVVENGCTDTSDCAEIIGLQVIENSPLNAIAVYPNPTNGFVNIELENLKNVTVEIWSIDHKLVFEKSQINSELLVIDLEVSEGIYIVEVSHDEFSKSHKLIITK